MTRYTAQACDCGCETWTVKGGGKVSAFGLTEKQARACAATLTDPDRHSQAAQCVLLLSAVVHSCGGKITVPDKLVDGLDQRSSISVDHDPGRGQWTVRIKPPEPEPPAATHSAPEVKQ